jgi:long-subunit fatty acid transport protein
MGGDLGVDAELQPVPDDEAQCQPGGTAEALRACISSTLPMIATLGARYIVRDGSGAERADIELDLRWEDWSAGSNTTILVDAADSVTQIPLDPSVTRRGLRDAYSIRLGGSYALPIGANRLLFRGGAAYDTAASPDQHTRVDFDGKARTTLATGVAYETSNFRVEVSGGVSLEGDITVEETCPGPTGDGPTGTEPGCLGDGEETPVRDRERPDPLQPKLGPFNPQESPINAGTYESGYILLSVGVTAWF